MKKATIEAARPSDGVMGTIRHIAFTRYPVNDMARARRFARVCFSKLQSYLVALVMLFFMRTLATAALVSSSGQFVPRHCDEAMAKARAAELRNLFDDDQKDRESLEGKTPLTGNIFDVMKKVDQRDFERRRRVAEIFAEGCIKTADDYYHAAMIYQHGNVPDHFLQAHIWAARALELGKKEAKWLSAASLDRYLMSRGYKQVYATQARTETDDDPNSCWCLWPVEETATEQLRRDYGVKTIAQQMVWINDMNKAKGRSCQPRVCPKKAKPVVRGAMAGISW